MGNGSSDVINGLIAVCGVWFGASLYHLIIYRAIGQACHNLAYGKDVCSHICGVARELLWSSKAVGASLGVLKSVGVATTEVYEFYIVVDTGEQYVVWLQVEVQHLMVVQITNCIEQLREEFVCVFLVLEIVGIVAEQVGKCLAIDILHQYSFIGGRDIPDEMRMFQTIACLKLLAECFLVADVAAVFWFQSFEEMHLAIDLHAKGVTGGSPCRYRLKGVKHWLIICKLRGVHYGVILP